MTDVAKCKNTTLRTSIAALSVMLAFGTASADAAGALRASGQQDPQAHALKLIKLRKSENAPRVESNGGQNNTVRIVQTGDNNRTLIRQVGNDNSINLAQHGGNNAQVIIQLGNGSHADVTQTGNQSGVILQFGH